MSSLSEQRTPASIIGNTAPTQLKTKRWVEVVESPPPAPLPGEANKTGRRITSKRKAQSRTRWQFVRFGLVGCLNTIIDMLVLNGLLWLWPTQNIARLVLLNTLAYACGALNSFVFNRSWTFQRPRRPTTHEGARFLLVTLSAIACNDLILWVMSTMFHPAPLPPTLWTNSSKVAATLGTIPVPYLGIRLWVFVQSTYDNQRVFGALFQRGGKSSPRDETSDAHLVSRVEREQGRVHRSSHTGNG